MDGRKPRSKSLISRKTATAVRAIGRMTALRLFSNQRKISGQESTVDSDPNAASLADLLQAKRQEDARRRQEEEEEKKEEEKEKKDRPDVGPELIDPRCVTGRLDIDPNDRHHHQRVHEPAVVSGRPADANRIIDLQRCTGRPPVESVSLPPSSRRAVDADNTTTATGVEGDSTDGSVTATSTTTRSSSISSSLNRSTTALDRAWQTPDTEAPLSNYGSDLTSDRTSDSGEYAIIKDRPSNSKKRARASSDESDSHLDGRGTSGTEEEDVEDTTDMMNGRGRAAQAEAATTIQAVYRGHRARKRTYQAPVVHQDLRDCQVLEGSAARFDCRLSGFPEPRVHWYKDGRELEESRHIVVEFEGEDLCSLIVREAGPDDEGVYKCLAKNAAGTAFSEAELLVEGKFPLRFYTPLFNSPITHSVSSLDTPPSNPYDCGTH
jgi:hypothetical protein